MFGLSTKIKGYRTLIGSGAIGLLGVANILGGVDLKPVVTMFVSDQHQVAVILIGAAVLFGTLRLMTNGPVGISAPGQPVKHVDNGV